MKYSAFVFEIITVTLFSNQISLTVAHSSEVQKG